jgi:hypothetical protein
MPCSSRSVWRGERVTSIVYAVYCPVAAAPLELPIMNRFSDIRSFEGTQARAWEELCFQVRVAPGYGHVETRKTKAPDGGVEWYDIYEDGHEEGFQAKFNPDLEAALSGMRESVRTVTARRPNMSRLTFLVPYDFSDTPGGRKSDQERWDDAVAGWQRDIPGADRITFAVIRGGDVLREMTREENAGRRMFWFGQLELTMEWFERRWTETRAIVGERYTPKAHSWSRIEQDISAVAFDPVFAIAVKDQVMRVVAACEADHAAWGRESTSVRADLDTLTAWLARSFGAATGTDGYEAVASQPDLDFETVQKCVDALIAEFTKAPRRDRAIGGAARIDRARNALLGLRRMVTGRAGVLCASRALAIAGEAGQGKTHALLHAARQMLDAEVPALVVAGVRFRAGAWWTQLAGILGGLNVTSDEFLAALDALGEARGRRVVVIIDALNESESPTGWQAELASLFAQTARHRWVSLIVSFRSDYLRAISPPAEMTVVNHPGLAGSEAEALKRYCALFEIPVPTASLFDAAFGNPLFLRLYCEVTARHPGLASDGISRSNLFERFTETRGEKVLAKLAVSPASTVVRDAINLMADHLIASGGRPVSREVVEPQINDLLGEPRNWPHTLFAALMSEGLIELQPPGREGVETAGLPFQAYSEHAVVTRLLDTVQARHTDLPDRIGILRRKKPDLPAMLAAELSDNRAFWRAAAVLVPERYGDELIELLPAQAEDYRLVQVTRESLSERRADAFTDRSFEILEALLDSDEPLAAVDVVLTLAPRVDHPANAHWLHRWLSAQAMPDRDATWGIASYDAIESPALQQIISWSDNDNQHASDDQLILVAIPLMWFLASPNRFLRDDLTKTLVQTFRRRLTALAQLINLARDVDDVYVQERMITVAYGAVMTGGDDDLPGVQAVVAALTTWCQRGLPINALARDSALGVISWAHDRGIVDSDTLSTFAPPYGAELPADPPTAAELEATFGRVPGPYDENTQWRAYSILSSCLDWMGDFHKYVIAGDVEEFSRHPLSGPPPSTTAGPDPLGETDAKWAGRWIAYRAINLGWTPERFAAFERNRDLSNGRSAHKAERFGKKYQWIAHHELMARLADNYHPARQPWHGEPTVYEGPWPWFGRDIDPSLPPSTVRDGSRMSLVNQPADGNWIILAEPNLDPRREAADWVAATDDLPDITVLAEPADPAGNNWICLHRYSSWHRESDGVRLSPGQRDLFLLQFCWLVPRGTGQAVHDLLVEQRLEGRWMPDLRKGRRQYLGEAGWAPIAATPPTLDMPARLHERGLRVTPATEEYLWEGTTLDCSIDQTLTFHTPTAQLLGSARWVGGSAEWAEAGRVVCRAITATDPAGRDHDALLADPGWLDRRLEHLGMELIIGTLGERHAVLDEDERMAWSDITYVTLVAPGEEHVRIGPLINLHQSE